MINFYAVTKNSEIQEKYAYIDFDDAEQAKINLVDFYGLVSDELEITEFLEENLPSGIDIFIKSSGEYICPDPVIFV